MAAAASPLEVVQAVYEGFAKRDIPKLLSLFSPEIEMLQSTEVPWGGHWRGHDGARQFFGTLTKHCASNMSPERFIRAGDNIVVVGWAHGTVIANGAPYRVPIAHVWTVSGGVVVRAQFFIDNPAMLAALAEPPASSK